MGRDYTSMDRTDIVRRLDDANGKLARIESEIEGIKAETAARLKEANADAQTYRAEALALEAELLRRERNDAIVPTISDHALLRYIERVHGLDIEAMKAALLTPAVVLAIKSGATAVKTNEGSFVIKGATVVTFKGADMDKPRRAPRDRDDADWIDELDGSYVKEPD